MSANAADESFYRPITLGMLKRLAGLLGPYRRGYAWVAAAGLVNAALEMIPPKLVGRAVDVLAKGPLAWAPLAQTAAVWLGVVAVTQLLHASQIRVANRAGERVLASLRQEVFDHLQLLSLAYFDRTHPGRIISRVANDVDQLRQIVVWGVNTLVANAALMLLAGTMLALSDMTVFLLVVWLVPLMAALSFLYAHRVGRAWQEVLRHSTRVSATQAENIAGVRVVAAFNRQAENLRSFNQLQELNTRNNVRASGLSGLFQAGLNVVRFGGQLLILLVGGHRVATGGMAAGTLVASSLYWEWLMQPAMNFGALVNDLMVAMAAGERLFAILDLGPGVADRPEAQPLPRARGHVRFEDVTFAYQPGRPVLRGVDFDIRPGTTVALVGATGSGKSTILSLLSRFYLPTAGRILIDGHDLRDVTGASLRGQMALVLQNNYLFQGTVIDNLRYARPDASLDDVVRAARTLGCHEHFLRMKAGYETQVGERGSALSLGERQLVCFTRALLANPSLLLLDEATSAVDPRTEAELKQALAVLSEGRTTFIVAHRLQTIFSADLILVLDHGRVVESGTHASLLQKRGAYAELVKHYREA